MNTRIAAVAAASLLFAVSAVSCGSSDSGSSSVTVNVKNTTEASSENATGTETATTEEKTTEAATTAEKTTESETETTTTEEVTEEQTTEEITEAETDAPEPATEAPQQANGTPVAGEQYLGCTISDMKDVFGEGIAYQAEACSPMSDDGNSYVYDFGGVVAECYLQSEEYYVANVNIVSAAYCTPEGITIGSTKSDVEAVYGQADVQGNGDLDYNKGSYELYFGMNGDTVSEVQYLLNY